MIDVTGRVGRWLLRGCEVKFEVDAELGRERDGVAGDEPGTVTPGADGVDGRRLEEDRSRESAHIADRAVGADGESEDDGALDAGGAGDGRVERPGAGELHGSGDEGIDGNRLGARRLIGSGLGVRATGLESAGRRKAVGKGVLRALG